jgi:hypothetical protein
MEGNGGKPDVPSRSGTVPSAAGNGHGRAGNTPRGAGNAHGPPMNAHAGARNAPSALVKLHKTSMKAHGALMELHGATMSVHEAPVKANGTIMNANRPAMNANNASVKNHGCFVKGHRVGVAHHRTPVVAHEASMRTGSVAMSRHRAVGYAARSIDHAADNNRSWHSSSAAKHPWFPSLSSVVRKVRAPPTLLLHPDSAPPFSAPSPRYPLLTPRYFSPLPVPSPTTKSPRTAVLPAGSEKWRRATCAGARLTSRWRPSRPRRTARRAR